MPALVGREAEFDAMRRFVAGSLRRAHKKVLFVFGACGQGKTSTVRALAAHDFRNDPDCAEAVAAVAGRRGRPAAPRVTFSYVHCAALGQAPFLRELTAAAGIAPRTAAQLRGVAAVAAAVKATARSAGPGVLRVIVLDEVDSLKPAGAAAVQQVVAACDDYGVVFVLVSNDADAPRRLAPPDRLSEPIVFEPYTADALAAIAGATPAGATVTREGLRLAACRTVALQSADPRQMLALCDAAARAGVRRVAAAAVAAGTAGTATPLLADVTNKENATRAAPAGAKRGRDCDADAAACGREGARRRTELQLPLPLQQQPQQRQQQQTTPPAAMAADAACATPADVAQAWLRSGGHDLAAGLPAQTALVLRCVVRCVAAKPRTKGIARRVTEAEVFAAYCGVWAGQAGAPTLAKGVFDVHLETLRDRSLVTRASGNQKEFALSAAVEAIEASLPKGGGGANVLHELGGASAATRMSAV